MLFFRMSNQRLTRVAITNAKTMPNAKLNPDKKVTSAYAMTCSKELFVKPRVSFQA